MRILRAALLAALLAVASAAAQADAVDALKAFVQEIKSGRAAFTQTVSSPDGAKTRTSVGSFEFLRPNRFRFAYTKPFEQLIVSDGLKVWIHDVDLGQVSSRAFSQALGATPAALLAGSDMSRDFELLAMPSTEGLDWVQATPRQREGSFQSIRIGFRAKQLVAVDLVDAFGQRSALRFSRFESNVDLPAQRFQFTVPPGVDVLEQ